MNKTRTRVLIALLNLAGFAVTIVVNALSMLRPFAGKTPGELSDAYPNLFVPAGFTFAIWGIIYLLLAFDVIYQFVFALKKRTPEVSFMEKAGLLFFLAAAGNVGWIFAWSYGMVGLSLGIMIYLLVVLLAIYQRLSIGKGMASGAERGLVHLPYSVYLGWISIATIANVSAFLVSIKWNRFGLSQQMWTVAVMLFGLLLALVMLFRRRDIFYALVVDWAFYGILLKRLADTQFHARYVIWTAYAGLAIISFGVLIQIVRGKVYRE
jgi:hypothetical protein